MPLLMAAVAATLLIAGCGNSGSGTTPPPPTKSPQGTQVTAVEKEYSITLSTNTFKPGVYTFDAQNQGTMPHTLNIMGPGVPQQGTPTIQAGQSAQLIVTLQAGTYELWCSIDGHKDLGMDVKIQVA